MSKKLLKINQEITVIPNDYRNSFRAQVKEIVENKITITSTNISFSPNEQLDVYSKTNEGILFFSCKILTSNEKVIEVKLLDKIDLLQQRKNLRKKCYIEAIIVDNNNKDIPVEIINISSQGLNIISRKELIIDNIYNIIFDLSINSKINSYIKIIDKIQSNSVYYVRAIFENNSDTNTSLINTYCQQKDSGNNR